jgi:hypothetical protein
VVVDRNERELKVRKGMDPHQRDNAKCSVDLLLLRTHKTLNDSMVTLFFVTIICNTLNLPYSTIGFVVGAALPPIVTTIVTIR